MFCYSKCSFVIEPSKSTTARVSKKKKKKKQHYLITIALFKKKKKRRYYLKNAKYKIAIQWSHLLVVILIQEINGMNLIKKSLLFFFFYEFLFKDI